MNKNAARFGDKDFGCEDRGEEPQETHLQVTLFKLGLIHEHGLNWVYVLKWVYTFELGPCIQTGSAAFKLVLCI